jgi:ABC transport system ATP-binding/permease protein
LSVLVSAQEVSKSFGTRTLFENLSVVVEEGDRIGLIGPNGAGKSTLLRLFSGENSPDEGKLSFQRGCRISLLDQSPVLSEMTVFDSVLEAAGAAEDPEALATAQQLLSHLSLNGPEVPSATKISELSGGWKKRVALARALAKRPDLLLMDEPTNHLDVESILWLEGFLARHNAATVTITHDRLFLQRIATTIWELDPRHPGGMLKVKGDYAHYVELKAELLEAQVQKEDSLRNTFRRETEWLRQGAKARTTKQQARIQRAGKLGVELQELSRRNVVRTSEFDFSSAGRSPKKLIEAKNISKSYGDKRVFSSINLLVTPQSRIGLLGPNGCGKSTLIKTLIEGSPTTGEVFRSDQLKVAYFEQTRAALDPKITLYKTVCPHGDQVNYAGRMVHIRGYLSKFLFRSEQLELPVGRLSGGEQSRILIAKLMLQPANVLVLDEPTNDLDLPTLEVLEQCLEEFEGAVFLVTHDRYFLDQVTEEILAFDPRPDHQGNIVTFAGLGQWENWYRTLESPKESARVEGGKGNRKKKFGFKEQREYQTMEATIQAVDETLAKLTAESEFPENVSSSGKLSEIYAEMGRLQNELDRLYARWAELEAIKEENK